MRGLYLALLAGCVLGTAPLEALLGARVYRRPWRLLLTVLPVLAVFTGWDVYAIVRRHWAYDPRQTTGVRLGVVPLEELLFFAVIPICAILTLEAVRVVRGWPVGDEGPVDGAGAPVAGGAACADGRTAAHTPATPRGGVAGAEVEGAEVAEGAEVEVDGAEVAGAVQVEIAGAEPAGSAVAGGAGGVVAGRVVARRVVPGAAPPAPEGVGDRLPTPAVSATPQDVGPAR